MATLYQLTDDYLTLLEMAEDPDIDEQAFMDTLEGIEGALEIKAEGYAKVIRTLEGDAAACDAESKRLRNKKQTIERNIDRMKKALQFAMESTGKTKFKTPLFSFNIQKNGYSVSILDESKIPDKYLIPQEPQVDKRAIVADLKGGEQYSWAELVQTKSLRIR